MQAYKGLTSAEVLEKRKKYGTNDLTPPKRESWVKLLLCKFNDPIIKLLLFATLLSLITGYFHGSMVESFGIIIAVLLATILSFLNEYKAGKEFDILNRVNDAIPVKVFRDGKACEIPKNEVVVGDYVIIAQGDEIPADGLLITSMDLAVNESSLNGESSDSRKSHIKAESYTGAYSPDRVYRGTNVTQGDGLFVVENVGDDTELGKTARHAAELTDNQTPLNRQLDRLGRFIGKAGFIVAGATFLALVTRDLLLGTLTFDATLENLTILLSFFMIAVTLIVVAVPEGLAMSVTLSLAYSMRKMTADHTLVRKMHACETMGAATVICTDKTGTLTQNKMRVQYSSVAPDEDFARGVALNSTAFIEEHGGIITSIGNPTEGAILAWLYEKGFDYRLYRESGSIIKRLPFNTERKYMATMAGDFLYVKGAPEIIFGRCGFCGNDMEWVKEYQGRGMRCLAFASLMLDEDDKQRDIEQIMAECRLAYRGFVAIADPIREDVPAAMAQCLKAGIKVKIVTGDTSLTAIEIARQAGLWSGSDGDDNFITGRDFERLDEREAAAAAKRIKVMARARPADKMRLVKLLQQMGEVVAVTGDGTNDAPALNYADVGLSMGTGTSVAKEASDIVLLDDSFASVVKAVKWGRSIYLNIQRFIQFQLTINLLALLTALIGPFVGVEFPLTVAQMLWVNLIMDTFAALALATEPALDSLMKNRPRRVDAFIITRRMRIDIISQGLVFLAALLALLFIFKADGLMTEKELSLFFTVFVMIQFWNLFNARALGGTRSAFANLGGNISFLFIAGVILVLQVIIVQIGGAFFRTAPLSFTEWVIILAATSPVLIAGEILRGARRLKEGAGW